MSDTDTRNARLFSFLESKQVLIIKPDLAVEIGLNEAILLQQINYWISNPLNKNLRDRRVWVHKTYAQWEQEFPFWSYNTIRRTIESLESQSLIISTQKYNSECKDQTKWYTLNNSLDLGTTAQNGHPPLPKMGTPPCPKWAVVPLNKITTETTTTERVVVCEIIDILAKTGIPLTEAKELFETYGEKAIQKQIDYLNETKKIKVISQEASWLRAAIVKNFNDGKPEKQKSKPYLSYEEEQADLEKRLKLTKIYSRSDNIEWWSTLHDTTKQGLYQNSLTKHPSLAGHFEQISVTAPEFTNHFSFGLLMELIDRLEKLPRDLQDYVNKMQSGENPAPLFNDLSVPNQSHRVAQENVSMA